MQPHKRAEHGSMAQEGVCVWCACVYACVCCVQARVRVCVYICVLCVHTVHAGQDDHMMQRLT